MGGVAAVASAGADESPGSMAEQLQQQQQQQQQQSSGMAASTTAAVHATAGADAGDDRPGSQAHAALPYSQEQLQALIGGTLKRRYWEPIHDGAGSVLDVYSIRGPHYLRDRKKIPAGGESSASVLL